MFIKSAGKLVGTILTGNKVKVISAERLQRRLD
jgi:hypothetical protein